ncbi:LysR family transcriptional regulator [Acerihabitans sp. TG2]|uniref:LysR family transcriptional regulator n=1 Tax=Acerihabitans sp. TG2 TaxID=3096008 RepID=UPI002B235582|nr:LysR family transcriptional regulator [Acerihabitans sp. TG2]MEA9390013.1 LysR family transcriptional regulator [Acerihabitans sp. TG2]
MNNFRGLDLNLLITLNMLLAEHNVTRAAQRLNLSQPSVSVQLGKLRNILDDPLLLPGPRGMRPTARADELREPLRMALDVLAHALSPTSVFNPAQASNTWRVAASDYGESTILLPALNGMRAAAPRTRLAVFELTPASIAKQMEQGEIDLAFHTSDNKTSNLRRRILFTERYVLVGRAGHPHLKNNLTIAQFCKLEQVIVSPDGGGFNSITDKILADMGLSRRVVLCVPHFLYMRSVLVSTDLVGLLPSRLVRDTDGLQMIAPPIDVPGFEMVMLWHERSHRDPAHRWLRGQIADAV